MATNKDYTCAKIQLARILTTCKELAKYIERLKPAVVKTSKVNKVNKAKPKVAPKGAKKVIKRVVKKSNAGRPKGSPNKTKLALAPSLSKDKVA